jgi:hypothetical protein
VALTAGGGMDYDLPFLKNRFSLRLFEADYRYMHADFGPVATIPTGGALGGRTNMNAMELSTGIVAHFGHIIPPPPVTYSCSVSPTSGYPGDPITVTGTALNLNPKKRDHLGDIERRQHRYQDDGTGHLHGVGSCDRRAEAG